GLAGGGVDRAHLRSRLPLSRPARHARSRARAPGRRLVRRLDRRRDGDDGVAPARLAGADRSRRHQGRGLDLPVPVRHGAAGPRGDGLPQPDGGAGAGAARHVDRHAGAALPAEHRAGTRGVEPVPVQPAAAHAAGPGRPRPAGAARLRRDVAQGDPGRDAPGLRRVRPRAAPGRAGGGSRRGHRILWRAKGDAVKFYYFHLMPYVMDHDEPSSWVTLSNRHYDPAVGHTLYHQYLDQLEFAEALGWDGICVNEHHQNCYGTMPSPNVMAAMLVRRTTKAKIAILGNGLPLRENPLRIAEEIAMLDVASGGRVISGFVRGISAEYFSTGV